MTGARLLYKPVGVVAGAAAGVLAGAVFRRVWRLVSGTDEVPQAREEDRGWGEVLAAAALQGAVFAAVRALADRAGAQGVRRVTGRWPR